jgi:adenylate cyclase
MVAREIERKYRVQNDDWRREAGAGTMYRQGYLSLDPERSVRVRAGGGQAFLTIKGQSQGAAREEFEYPIPEQDAGQLLDTLCIQPLIEKTRYVIRRGHLKWEIDEFHGRNRGLIIAEVELADDRQPVDLPAWLGEEVTRDPRYYNLSLVRLPYSQWADSH